MRCRVRRPFFTRRGGHIYAVGETFEGSRSQVGLLAARGLVDSVKEVRELVPESSEAVAPDLSVMTCAELRALCAERGVTAPKRATKAQLVALLD